MRALLTFLVSVTFVMCFLAKVPAAPEVVPKGVCDSSDVLELIRLAHGASDKSAVTKILTSRLDTCNTLIEQQLEKHPVPKTAPTPMPWSAAPPPPAAAQKPTECKSSSSNNLTLYGDLVVCVAYWKNLSASPSSTPAPPTFTAARPTFYVFATGTVDATTNAMLIRSMVRRLQEESIIAGTPEAKQQQWVVLGRNDWTSISNYTTQCQNDSNTQGAVVIEGDYPVAYSNNYLLVINTGEQVRANIEVLGCDPLNNGTSVPPLTLLAATDLGGKSSTSALPLGVWGATAVLFTNNNQTTTTTTTVTPPPSSPAPPPPKTQTTITTTSSDLTPALAANALATSLGTVTTPTANAPWLLSNAAWRWSDNLFRVLHENCTQTVDTAFGQKYVKYFVSIPRLGDLRKLPTYPSGTDVAQYKDNLDYYRGVFSLGMICNEFDDFAQTQDSTLNPLPPIGGSE